MYEKLVEEHFDFGRKRIYTIKYLNDPDILFPRDENGYLIPSSKSKYIEGELKEFDREGRLYHTSNFIKGILHGEYKMYHPNGQLYSEVNYVDGKREGDFKMYNKDGTLHSKYFYVNNEIV